LAASASSTSRLGSWGLIIIFLVQATAQHCNAIVQQRILASLPLRKVQPQESHVTEVGTEENVAD
jgi:hypothetical protein